jgi:hypothetical protein
MFEYNITAYISKSFALFLFGKKPEYDHQPCHLTEVVITYSESQSAAGETSGTLKAGNEICLQLKQIDI